MDKRGRLKSNFGNCILDNYIVFETKDGKRGEQVTGVFVLRVSKEKEAFEALKFFYNSLVENTQGEDDRIDELRNWIERLNSLFS